MALSFDGLPVTQNINRCSSANNVDLEFFRQTWLNQKIQMTINENTVDKMAEGVISLIENNFSVNPSIAYEKYEWSDKSIETYLKQMLTMMDYYLFHSEKPLIHQFQHPLIDYAKELVKPTTQKQQCNQTRMQERKVTV